MRTLKLSLLLLTFLLVGGGKVFAQKTTLCINEVMQSNIDNLFVEQDFPDSWLELYNPTDNDIDIWHYYLSLENSIAGAYQIVGAHPIVPAHGHLVVCCDKVGNKLHTDFRIDSGKGAVYLFHRNGTLLDNVTLAKMPAANVAYCRVTDAADNWQYAVTPTPGATNNSVCSAQLLPDPVFSVTGGVMSSPVSVVVSKPEGSYPEDTRLYVTTDGSEPTVDSPTDDSFIFNISTTTVIRAKLISANALTPRSVTQSYIYHPRETTLPIISLVTDDSYLYGDEIGILSTNVRAGAKQANYLFDWRRPINVEMYDTKNGSTLLMNQLTETALSGGASRGNIQKSMKLYANKRFGAKRFAGNFWDDKPGVSESKSFIIRNGGNNCNGARVNDAVVQTLFGKHVQNLDWQAYRPVIVYINGVYKGEYGMRERSNEDYVAANYDGLEDIENVDQTAYYNAASRNNTLFQDFYDVYTSEDVTYADLAEKMDVDNFMGALIAEMYSGNNDWPHNNVSMWRPTEDGGKWRWILKDMDKITTTEVGYNMFEYLFVENGSSTESKDGSRYGHVPPSRALYKKMMSYPEFYNAFIDRYSTYLGDFLKPEVCIALIDKYGAEIADEIVPTFEANENMSTLEKYNTSVNTLKTYMQQRPAIVYQQMADYFNLGTVIPLKIAANGQDVRINNVGLTEGDFDGAYFSNRQLTLSTGASNYGWKLYVTHSDNSVSNYEIREAETTILLSDYYNSNKDVISVDFETFMMEKSDFEKKIESLEIETSSLNDQSESLTPLFAEPTCAYLNIISENGIPSTKSEVLSAYIDFYDNNGSYMRKGITLSQQGSDVDNMYKKNLAITFNPAGADDMDVTFGSWVPQNEFHLKAFYSDGLRGTAEIAYKLYDQIMGIEEGARMTGDAFPCVVYVNGNFQGIYAWQLKKHRKNMGLAKDDSKQVWLDGTLNDKQLFAPETSINWTKFEVCNPKDLYNMDGTDYDGENPQELMDETSDAYVAKKKQVRCAEAKAHIIALSHYSAELMNLETGGATVEEMRNAIADRFDVDNLVKYMVFSLATNNYDGFSKKWQWYTLDGQHWAVAPYDCELTFGYNDDDITKLWTADKSSKKYDYKMENATKDGPMLWIKRYYWNEVKTEWSAQRRSGVISAENIMTLVNGWLDRVASEDGANEWSKWSDSPVEDNADRIESWITQRLSLEDEYLEYQTLGQFDLTFGSHKQRTVCLPFAFEIPSGLTVYKVLSVDESTMKPVLTKVKKTEAHKPYWVGGAYNTTYHLEGEIEPADESSDDYLVNGALVGTYEDIYASVGDYVTNGSKFSKVTTMNSAVVVANNAYVKNNKEIVVASYDVEFANHKQRTICLPFAFEIPTGLGVYKLLDIVDGVKVITTVKKTEPNKPYMISGGYNTSFTLTGVVEETEEPLVNGLLTGTYEDIYVCEGNIVFPHPVSGRSIFYMVGNESVHVRANHAYVVCDPISAPAKTRALNAALYGETTDIDNLEIEEDAEIIGIFNASGQKIPVMQKGMNIIKYSNGKTDKFLLK